MRALQALILAGGCSSRMGSPKHLLPLPDGPLYIRLVRTLHNALPDLKKIHVSVADRSSLDDILRNGIIDLPPEGEPGLNTIKLELLFDHAEDIGPAAGLLAAHHQIPTATWLIVACDYPLLDAEAVHQLIASYTAPATCFENFEGFSEPLLGIWSPQAMHTLDENVKSGRSGPAYTLKMLSSKLIVPYNQEWLTNVNNKHEWESVKAQMQ